MKIGILTVPFNNNYGGLLQAFALKAVLSEQGHTVVFLNRKRNKQNSLKFKVYNILVKLHIIDNYLEKRANALSVNTDAFKKQYIYPITEPYYSTQEFQKITGLDIDFFIVGSDQVWRYSYAEDSIDDYFFNILAEDNKPRISYAASFGTDVMDYPEEKLVKAKELLKLFKGVSVREPSGKLLINKYLGLPLEKVQVVLDPTLLLDANKYKAIIKSNYTTEKNYIFTYILDNHLIDEKSLQLLCSKFNCSRIDLKAQTGDLSKISVISPVEQWLDSISHSKAVVTDSYHGTVFSIIFNRQFVVVANPERGITRLKELLSVFELEDRLITHFDDSIVDIMSKPINWEKVNVIIKNRREESLCFLHSMLD